MPAGSSPGVHCRNASHNDKAPAATRGMFMIQSATLLSPLTVQVLTDRRAYEEEGRLDEFDLIGVALAGNPVAEFSDKPRYYTSALLQDDLDAHFGQPVVIEETEAAA